MALKGNHDPSVLHFIPYLSITHLPLQTLLEQKTEKKHLHPVDFTLPAIFNLYAYIHVRTMAIEGARSCHPI